MEKSDSDAHEQTVIIASVFILPQTLSIKFHALDCISNDCYGCYGPSQSSIVPGRESKGRQNDRTLGIVLRISIWPFGCHRDTSLLTCKGWPWR